MPKPRVYLASPLGFADSTHPFMTIAVDQLSEFVDVVNPWDDHQFDQDLFEARKLRDVEERDARFARINEQIGRANVAHIDSCDAVFAVLDGVDVDSGTAAEIGYAYARGKLVCGLRTDFRLAGDNPGSIVNLQVQYFIEASGGSVVITQADFRALASRLAAGDLTASTT